MSITMHMCMNVHICVQTWLHLCACMCMHMWTYECTYTYMSIHVDMNTYVLAYMYVHICACVCIYVCIVYRYVCIYKCVSKCVCINMCAFLYVKINAIWHYQNLSHTSTYSILAQKKCNSKYYFFSTWHAFIIRLLFKVVCNYCELHTTQK